MVMPTSNDQRISNGGLINDAQGIAYTTTASVYFGGTAMTFDTSGGVGADYFPSVKPAGKTDKPIGYAFKSTLDPNVPYDYVTSTSYQYNKKLTVNRWRDGDIVSVPLAGNHATIAVGDTITVANAYGEFDKDSNVSAETYAYGIAMDPIAAGTGSSQAGANASCIRMRVLLEKVA